MISRVARNGFGMQDFEEQVQRVTTSERQGDRHRSSGGFYVVGRRSTTVRNTRHFSHCLISPAMKALDVVEPGGAFLTSERSGDGNRAMRIRWELWLPRLLRMPCSIFADRDFFLNLAGEQRFPSAGALRTSGRSPRVESGEHRGSSLGLVDMSGRRVVAGFRPPAGPRAVKCLDPSIVCRR
jgi:hypothetical protein